MILLVKLFHIICFKVEVVYHHNTDKLLKIVKKIDPTNIKFCYDGH